MKTYFSLLLKFKVCNVFWREKSHVVRSPGKQKQSHVIALRGECVGHSDRGGGRSCDVLRDFVEHGDEARFVKTLSLEAVRQTYTHGDTLAHPEPTAERL